MKRMKTDYYCLKWPNLQSTNSPLWITLDLKNEITKLALKRAHVGQIQRMEPSRYSDDPLYLIACQVLIKACKEVAVQN